MFEKGAIAKYSETVHKVTGYVAGKRYMLDNGKSYLYYQLKPVGEVQRPDAPLESRPKDAGLHPHAFSPVEVKDPVETQPKNERLALQKEGVEKKNMREGLRERKPAVGVVTKHGEKVNW